MTDHILFETKGAAGLITLDRPKALNAMTRPMVEAMHRALDRWEDDPSVTCIVVSSTSDRAFCAGGDVRAMAELVKEGRPDEALCFWREEYRLNRRILNYPKPYLCLIEGIVMGGGVGVSLHGSHRIAADKYLFAMPEADIGFFPDIGATFFLPRLPGEIGLFLGLTGERIGQSDALALGLATHAAPASAFDDIRKGLIAQIPIDKLLAPFEMPRSPLSLQTELIDFCFSASSVENILGRLDGQTAHSSFAKTWAAALRKKSPSSLKIIFEQLRRGRHLSFDEALKLEFRLASRLIVRTDFYEGVRAALVDKDRSPRWRPDRLKDISPQEVAACFAPLSIDELDWS